MKLTAFGFVVLCAVSSTALADDFCYQFTRTLGEDNGVTIQIFCSDGQTHFSKSVRRALLVGPMSQQQIDAALGDADAKMRSEGFQYVATFGQSQIPRKLYQRTSGAPAKNVCLAFRGRNTVPIWRDLPGSSYKLDCNDGAVTSFSTENRATATDDQLFVEYARSRGLSQIGRIDGYDQFINSSAILVLKKQ